MAGKLKSISKRIHWSLLLKAVVFAIAWFLFPFWLFFLIALYLYFVPIAQSGTVVGPFLVLILLTFLEPTSALFALVFGVVFFYILLIKDLILIDRKSVYEVIVLFLSFLLLLGFYKDEGGSLSVSSLLYSLCGAVIVGYLISGFLRFSLDRPITALARSAVWLSTALIWQFIIAGLYLPVDFVYQTVAAFLGVTLIIDLVPQYLFGESSREKILTTLSVIFVLFVFILGSARWGL